MSHYQKTDYLKCTQLLKNYLQKSYNDIIIETCETTDIGQSRFCGIKRQARGCPVVTPKKSRKEVPLKSSRKIKYDEFIKNENRQYVRRWRTSSSDSDTSSVRESNDPLMSSVILNSSLTVLLSTVNVHTNSEYNFRITILITLYFLNICLCINRNQ